MNAFYFVVDENLTDIANAQAYHLTKMWACDVHIFIERRNKNQLVKTIDYNGRIYYHYDKLMQFLPHGLPSNNKWPLIVYLRLFAPRFLKSYDRVLYLDADIHCLQATQELWSTSLPSGVGAVTDFGSLKVPPRPFETLTRSEWLQHIGVPSLSYLNSGVLLIDVLKWTKIDFAEKLSEYFKKHPDAGCFDQDFLSSFLDGNWTDIGPRFNYQAVLLNSGLSSAISPVFVHFSQPEKPWYGWHDNGVTTLDPHFGEIYRGLLTQINVSASSHVRADTTKRMKKIKTTFRRILSIYGLKSKKERDAFKSNKHDREIYIEKIASSEAGATLETNKLDVIYFDGRNIRSKFVFPSQTTN